MAKHIPMHLYRKAQAKMRSRSFRARSADRHRRAKITRNVSLWASNPAAYDIPGIDKKRRPRRRRLTRR